MNHLTGWIAWGAATLFVLYQLATQNSMNALAGPLEADLKFTTADVGLVSAAFLVTYAVMQMPAGLLLDRYRPRYLLPPMALGVGVTAWLFSMSGGLGTAMLSRAAMGVFAAFAFPGAGLVARRRLPPHRFALAMGLIDFAFGMGAAAGDDVVQALLQVQDWRGVMVDFAVFGGLIAVLCAMLIGRTTGRGETATSEALSRSMWKSIREIASVRQVRLAALVYASMMGIVFGFGGLWDVPLQEAFGWSRTDAVGLNAWMWIGLAIMPPFVGWLSDRWRRRRPFLLVGQLFVIVGMTLLLILPMPLPFWFVAAHLFLVGLALGTSMLCFPIACDAVDSANAGAAIGFVNAVGLLAAAVLQLLPGLVLVLTDSHTLDTYRWVLGMYVLVLAAGAVCILRLAPVERDPG